MLLNNIVQGFHQAINERISEFTEVLNDNIMLTKEGTIKYRYDNTIMDITVPVREGKIVQLSSCYTFALALSEIGNLLLIKYYGTSHYVYCIESGVISFYAGGTQIYFETETTFFGAQRIIPPAPRGQSTNVEDAIVNTIWNQISIRVAKVDGEAIKSLSIGPNHAAAVMEDTNTHNTWLLTWGDNKELQCGDYLSGRSTITFAEAYNVTINNKAIAKPVQVCCNREATCFTTVTKEFFVMNKKGDGRPLRVDLGINDPLNMYCSISSPSMIVTRESGGAIGLGSSPHGNLGCIFTREHKDFFVPVKLYELQRKNVTHVSMGKALTFVKAEPIVRQIIDWQRLQKYPWDLDIITVTERKGRKRKERDDEEAMTSNKKAKLYYV
jgi:hypothetical protein